MAIKMKTALLGDTVQRKSKRAEMGSEGHNVFTAVKVLKPEAFSVSWQQHRNIRSFESHFLIFSTQNTQEIPDKSPGNQRLVLCLHPSC